MSKSKYKRKLTAILSADVVGYSRLMGDDEEFTIQTLNAYRDLMTTLIEDYSGSVVDAVGDNLLAEFTSVVDAVQCAVAIQTKLKKQNEKLAVSRHMLFRIGINIGDIIQEKGRIYGDGVNIAARIESLADSGGICISRGTYDHIKKKLDFSYEYIGEHSVKNISDPVRVYKVLVDPNDAEKRINEKQNPSVKKSPLKKWLLRISVSIILILLIVLAGVYWKYIYLPAPADIDFEGKMEFNLPTVPSIAVLPFDNMSKDPEQEYFCDGMTENIISALAQTQQLIVIARNSTFAYKGKFIDARQIGQELNAQYLIEGSIQKSNNRYRFVMQLIEADSRAHIWSGRYDLEFKDIFKLQDEVTLKILKVIGVELTTSGSYEKIFEEVNDINSFIKLEKVRGYFRNPTREGYASALRNIKEIIVLNPEYPLRYDMLASVYITGIFHNPGESPVRKLFLASEAVKKSLSLDENNYLVHQTLAWLFLLRKEPDKAIASIKKSIELRPINADAYFVMGYILNTVGKPSEALESMKIAIRLNPLPPSQYLFTLGMSYLILGQYEKVIETYKELINRQSDYWPAYAGLAVAYGLSGQEEKAAMEVKELLVLFPNYSIKQFEKYSFFKNQDDIDRCTKALRKAGLPEE